MKKKKTKRRRKREKSKESNWLANSRPAGNGGRGGGCGRGGGDDGQWNGQIDEKGLSSEVSSGMCSARLGCSRTWWDTTAQYGSGSCSGSTQFTESPVTSGGRAAAGILFAHPNTEEQQVT